MKKFISLILLFFFASCGKNVVLDKLYSFENRGWHMDSVIIAQWEPIDSEEPVFMSMYIRHTTDYPYNNIYLFRSIESTQGIEYTDTVNVALADPLGVWNGSGMSNLKTLEIPIGKGAVRFLDDERYTLRITQGMRDTLLLGIQDVGIQFEQVKSGK
ncbi:gliding motility lipoprotein GldH [Schleiferiaceae bacterium]|jgi:gliding motility-associated lipoprotein GldH|nr:hypothetical protein [Flavobacteriales bacterium]MDC1021984.1 gliding motility lipoprotein GldH [Schleiferiaceae bacterium]|tara:strand:+ start:7200 stop:7670 length:471 start_codon:yes stop_codon:yes gene_type:complete